MDVIVSSFAGRRTTHNKESLMVTKDAGVFGCQDHAGRGPGLLAVPWVAPLEIQRPVLVWKVLTRPFWNTLSAHPRQINVQPSWRALRRQDNRLPAPFQATHSTNSVGPYPGHYVLDFPSGLLQGQGRPVNSSGGCKRSEPATFFRMGQKLCPEVWVREAVVPLFAIHTLDADT